MLNLLKALVVVGLLAAIGGGAYGTYYLLIKRPQERDAREAIEAVQRSGSPTPDPSTPDFEKAQALKRDQNYPEARAALEAFLIRYPDSSRRDEALGLFGDMNLSELFSGQPGPGKSVYIVQRGDVLDRVAHKTKSDPELIYQANSLDRIMLRIGQKLIIPEVDFSIDVHLSAKRLTLLNHGKFFKVYPLQDVRPFGKKPGVIHTKVQEKIANQNDRRVVFGSREFANSLRSLTLTGEPGYTIYAQPDPGQGNGRPPGSGLALIPSDAEELHSLVSVGTPVTITAK